MIPWDRLLAASDQSAQGIISVRVRVSGLHAHPRINLQWCFTVLGYSAGCERSPSKPRSQRLGALTDKIWLYSLCDFVAGLRITYAVYTVAFHDLCLGRCHVSAGVAVA